MFNFILYVVSCHSFVFVLNISFCFSRFPIFYGQIAGGRALAIIFFFSLAMAGFSSLVAQIEMLVHNVVDLGGKKITEDQM